MDQFADIRPYNDAEVPAVLERLLDDAEFLAAICRLKFKGFSSWLGLPLRALVRRALRGELERLRALSSLLDDEPVGGNCATGGAAPW